MQVSVIFNADTGQYEAKLAGLDAKTAKSAQAVADAKNKILAYHREQIQSAAALGKSAEDLERIQSKSAAAMANVTETNATKIIASIDRIRERNAKMQAELANLPKLPTAPHQADITDRMATSGVVRFAENNGGIRATENFIASIPGAGVAMQALFPIVGAAGLAGLFIDMGVKGYEAFEKVRNAVKDTQRAFDEMDSKERVQIDDLEIENQKIQDQIDKLSGHPNNGLASALLEAKKMADQLLVSLQEDRKQLEAIFKEHSVGTLQSFFTGVATTGAQEKNITVDEGNLDSRIQDINDKFDAQTSGVKDKDALKKATDARNAAVREAIQSQIDNYKREVGRLAKEQADSEADARLNHSEELASGGYRALDNSAKITELNNVIRHLQRRSRVEDLNEDIYSGNEKLGGLKQDKELGELGDKAAQKQMKALEEQAAQLELDGATPKAIYDFWDRNRNAFLTGSEQYNQVVEKQAAIAKTGAEKAHAAIIEFQKQSQRQEVPLLAPRDVNVQGNTRESNNRVEDMAARERLASAVLESEAARTKVAIDLADGSISKLSADQQLAAISAKLHADRLADLHRQLDQFQQNANSFNPLLGRYTDDKEQEKYLELTGQMAREAAQESIDAMRNAAEVSADSWRTSLSTAFDQWYQHAKDTAAQVADIFNRTIEETNRNLVDLMSGDYKRGDFKKEGHDLFKTVSGDLLEQAEAPLAKLAKDGLGKIFGISGTGKPDGTPNNPFHVVLGAGASQSDSSGGLMSLFRGIFNHGATDNGPSGLGDLFGSFGSGASDAGGGLGDLIGSAGEDIVPFLGGFALGGDVPESGIADVGEMGREKVLLPAGSKVIPNSQLGGDTHIHIDARDSTDPAQTEARLHRAIQSYIPGIVGASLAAQREQRLRQPSTKR